MIEKRVRIQKFISESGYCSRRKAEELISKGQVKVNSVIIKEFGIKIDPFKDVIEIKNKRLSYGEKKVYIALNKPPGYVSSCHHRGKKIILDLVSIRERVYPAGRLDMQSRGLILLTNDGKLHHTLSHPSFNHEKEYIVRTDIPLTNAEIKRLENGIIIDGKKTRKAVIKKKGKALYLFIIKEGRNRQIRKMISSLNKKILDLKRTRISSIKLEGLKEGTWRYLNKNEISLLKKNTKSKNIHD
ncbi:MAG: pseudouridine synthase [Deltaproteobacteria bacterium]|nr:MAG: pseudouridine synthase [Deltaproteobacteria bacterium]